jgi:hypothetical protein
VEARVSQPEPPKTELKATDPAPAPAHEEIETAPKPVQTDTPAPTETAKPEPTKLVNKTDLSRSNPFDKTSDVDDTDATKKKTPPDKPVAEGGDTKKTDQPGPNKTPPAPVKPKAPAFVRGKPCDLFPPDRTSHAENVPDPKNAGKMTMGEKYDGWNFNSQQVQGFSVKDGVLNIDKQGIMILDQYPVLEYRISFEVELSKNSAVGLLVGANGAIVNLMIVTETHCLSGTWDQGKTENNVNGDNKSAKAHGVKDGWIPVQVSVRADSVDFVIGNRPAMNLKLAKPSSMAQLGFMLLGTNKNNSPTCKIRKAILTAP